MAITGEFAYLTQLTLNNAEHRTGQSKACSLGHWLHFIGQTISRYRAIFITCGLITKKQHHVSLMRHKPVMLTRTQAQGQGQGLTLLHIAQFRSFLHCEQNVSSKQGCFIGVTPLAIKVTLFSTVTLLLLFIFILLVAQFVYSLSSVK